MFEGDDIALLKLSSPFRLSKSVNFVVLSRGFVEEKVGDVCIVTGWGFFDAIRTVNSSILQKGKATVSR